MCRICRSRLTVCIRYSGYTLHNSTSLSGASAPVWQYLSRRWLVTHWAACLNSYAYIVRSRSEPQLMLAATHLILLVKTKLLLFLHFFLANSNFYHKFLHFLANSDIEDSKSSDFLANSLTRNALLWNLGDDIYPPYRSFNFQQLFFYNIFW